MKIKLHLLNAVTALWISSLLSCGQVFGGLLNLTIQDQAGRPIACRIHLYDSTGKAHRAEGLPFWRDHFVCPGKANLELAPGSYRYEIERGPEYEQLRGTVEIADRETEVRETLRRIANLANRGWYSGDLHIHRNLEEVPLLMNAEDLNVGPVITWWNRRNLWTRRAVPERTTRTLNSDRILNVMAGEDEREGGALLYFHLAQPVAIAESTREFPSPMVYLERARQQNPHVWVDIEKPFWWDVPIWLALGRVNSIGIANNHMCRSQMYLNEAWGKPRDQQRLPNPLGNGFWTQEIYYHLLNAGLRIPPSAGSASGVLPNPVGYNRVYVHLDGELDHASWWDGLGQGRSFVTNGPLLLTKINGQLPGHVFRLGGAAQDLAVEVELVSRSPVARVEIIQNGKITRTVADPGKDNTLPIKVDRSGWLLVRAICDNPKTFRFASSAPFYFEGDRPVAISKSSTRFFLDWAVERKARVPRLLKDPEQLESVLQYHDQAIEYWARRHREANAD